jgi:hypothetical protein
MSSSSVASVLVAISKHSCSRGGREEKEDRVTSHPGEEAAGADEADGGVEAGAVLSPGVAASRTRAWRDR